MDDNPTSIAFRALYERARALRQKPMLHLSLTIDHRLQAWTFSKLPPAQRASIRCAVAAGSPVYVELHNILTQARLLGAEVKNWPMFSDE